MYPVNTYEEIGKEIFEKYQDFDAVTVGILVADGEQDDALQFIMHYMDIFDRNSGNYFDFFIPGYYEEGGENPKGYHPNANIGYAVGKSVFYLSRNNTSYYFDRMVFNEFVFNMQTSMGIEYTYNPMLILVEIKKDKCRGELKYQDKIVIELDSDSQAGVRRAGQLFDAIFEEAKRSTGLKRFGNRVKIYFIKGRAVKTITRALCSKWALIEPIASGIEGGYRYRIR